MNSTTAQAEKMMSLFAGHESAHGTHGEPVKDGLKWAIKTTADTRREPVTLDMWRRHLAGKRPLGVVPINTKNECVWGSIDVDEYDADLLAIVRTVEGKKYPLVPCVSKSGGLHLFLFTSEPVPAGDMLSTLRALAASLGLAGCEIFPKQTHVLTERGDVGNWMVMPYYGDTFGGKLREQRGLKKTGSEMTLQEFISLAQRMQLTAAQFAALAKSTRSEKVTAVTRGKKGSKRGGTSASGPFGDGPPCLQHLSVGGFPEGGRNNALFMIGLYLKRAHPTDWPRKLEEDNQNHMRPPLTSDEVTSVRKQLEKRDYEYTCKNEPMASHCDAGLCRTRKFGVGDSGEFPTISSMSKLNSEPAIWFIDVGDKRLEVATPDLINYARFQTVCAEQHGVFFSSMKQSDWVRVLGDAAKGMVTIDPPPDVGLQGRFVELVEEFLTNRARGERKEDLHMGRPWFDEDTKRHYFRLRDLQNFIVREGIKDFTRGQITRRVTRMGGGHHGMQIKKHYTNLWFVPDESIQHAQELSAPPIEGEDV